MQQKSRRTNSDPLFTGQSLLRIMPHYSMVKHKIQHSMKIALLVACTWRNDRTILQWTLHLLSNNINHAWQPQETCQPLCEDELVFLCRSCLLIVTMQSNNNKTFLYIHQIIVYKHVCICPEELWALHLCKNLFFKEWKILYMLQQSVHLPWHDARYKLVYKTAELSHVNLHCKLPNAI